MAKIQREKLADVFDGARLVRSNEVDTKVAVWHGGVTINIYEMWTLDGITCFSLSDDLGEPCSRDEVDEHIQDIFENDRYFQ